MSGSLTQIIYRSIAVGHPTELDLHPILATARAFNAANEITGMLLYRQQVFVQLLEGPEDIVRELYGRISEDERHRNVETLADNEIARRRFGHWSMAFRVFDRLGPLPIRGLSPALQQREINLVLLDPAEADALFEDLSKTV